MTVREILVKTSDYLQLEDVKGYLLDYIKNENLEDGTLPEIDDEIEYQLNLLIDCLNNVLIDISTNYILLKKQEQISVINNVFNCQLLSEPLYKVLKVFDLSGDIEFNYEDDYLTCKNGACAIKYAYYPSLVNINGSVNTFNNRVNVLTFAYGIAGEYCLIKGDYEQAQMWSEKYKNNLLNSVRPIKNVAIKRRRWF